MQAKTILIFKWIYIIGWLINLPFLYFRIASIMTTLWFYILLGLLGYWVLNKGIDKWWSREKALNLRISVFTLLIGLFLVEFGLRFIVKKHLSYTEKNGQFAYFSVYQDVFFLEKFGFLDKGLWKHNTLTLHFDNVEFDYKHQYNSLGLRDVEFDILAKDTTTKKILGIGDSFTEGVGTDSDYTWLKSLERALNTKVNNQTFVTMNGGIMGSDQVFGFELLDRDLDVFEPDMVLLTVNNTDINDIILRGGENRYLTKETIQVRKPPFWEHLYAISFIFRVVIHDVLDYNRVFMRPTEYVEAKQEAENIIIQQIKRFQKKAKAEGFQFAVIAHPMIYEIQEESYRIADLVQQLENMPSLHFIDLHKKYINEIGMNKENVLDYYWALDDHHNSKGYEIWGKLVGAYLIENGLIEKTN